jgi:hypothetical protein
MSFRASTSIVQLNHLYRSHHRTAEAVRNIVMSSFFNRIAKYVTLGSTKVSFPILVDLDDAGELIRQRLVGRDLDGNKFYELPAANGELYLTRCSVNQLILGRWEHEAGRRVQGDEGYRRLHFGRAEATG